MVKTYIHDFIEYNYKPIAFHISEIDNEFLACKLKQDMVNKTWRLDYAKDGGDDIIFIANCDVDYYSAPAAIPLLDEGYDIYVLKHDEGGFYYEHD